MTRGQRRSLLFHCGGLAPPTPCRFYRRTTHVTACILARPLTGSFTPKASAASSPPRLLRLLPAGATVAGWDSHPRKFRDYARRTENGVVRSAGGSRPLLTFPMDWRVNRRLASAASRVQ